MQETAYQAYLSKDKIKDKDKFKSWILKIASNKAKDLLRKNKNNSFDNISNIENIKDKDSENINLFLDNLKILSFEEKNIIVLKIYFEYTFSDISKELLVPENTIKTKYYRALNKLKLEEI